MLAPQRRGGGRAAARAVGGSRVSFTVSSTSSASVSDMNRRLSRFRCLSALANSGLLLVLRVGGACVTLRGPRGIQTQET